MKKKICRLSQSFFFRFVDNNTMLVSVIEVKEKINAPKPKRLKKYPKSIILWNITHTFS